MGPSKGGTPIQYSRFDALAGYPIMLSVQDVAEILNVSRHSAQRYMEKELRDVLVFVSKTTKYRVLRVPREVLRQKLGIPEARLVRFDK